MSVANSYGFDVNYVIFGDFGLWHDYANAEVGAWTLADDDVINYYTYIFQALNNAGYKWTLTLLQARAYSEIGEKLL